MIPIQPILGFLAAGVCGGVIFLAEAATQIPAEARGWLEAGGTVGLIAGLSIGLVTLYRDNLASRREIMDLNKEIRTEFKTQNRELIECLDRLREGK